MPENALFLTVANNDSGGLTIDLADDRLIGMRVVRAWIDPTGELCVVTAPPVPTNEGESVA